jgi:sulfate adenylyltransferase subunit 1 (EFTu-like GTPase family)
LRDSVLTAREADYLIHLSNPKNIISWINSWEDKRFIGQKYNFYLHTIIKLNEKYLEVEGDAEFPKQESKDDVNLNKISFPSVAVLLVGSKQEKTEELDGLDVISYHLTTEFEIILREDLDIIEIRGPYQVVRDFVSTAILDDDNPLSAAKSYFIGDIEDAKRSLVKPIRQVIKIDALKQLLNGSYRKLAAMFPGTKASKFEATLEDKPRSR